MAQIKCPNCGKKAPTTGHPLLVCESPARNQEPEAAAIVEHSTNGSQNRPAMTREEAQAITKRIKNTAEALWELLTEAHEREAWKVLGYETWREYVIAEFAMSERNSYYLLDQAEVSHALQGASGLKHASVSQRQAISLKPHLAEVKKEISSAIDEGIEPHEAVSATLKKFSVLPSANEARHQGRW